MHTMCLQMEDKREQVGGNVTFIHTGGKKSQLSYHAQRCNLAKHNVSLQRSIRRDSHILKSLS